MFPVFFFWPCPLLYKRGVDIDSEPDRRRSITRRRPTGRLCALEELGFFVLFFVSLSPACLHVHAAAKRNSVSNYKSSRYRESPPAYLLTALRLLIILFSLFLSPFFFFTAIGCRPTHVHTHTTYGSSFIDVYTLRSPKETKTKSAHSFCNIKTHQIDAELRKNMRTPVDQPPHLNELRKEERGPSSLQTPLLLMSIVVIYLSIYIFFFNPLFLWREINTFLQRGKSQNLFFLLVTHRQLCGRQNTRVCPFYFLFCGPEISSIMSGIEGPTFSRKEGGKKKNAT